MTYYSEEYELPYENRTEERSRRERWMAKGRARVTHPKYKSVIVPHASAYGAILNAAEYWGCDYMDIHGEVKVEWVPPKTGPLVIPKKYREEYRK